MWGYSSESLRVGDVEVFAVPMVSEGESSADNVAAVGLSIWRSSEGESTLTPPLAPSFTSYILFFSHIMIPVCCSLINLSNLERCLAVRTNSINSRPPGGRKFES